MNIYFKKILYLCSEMTDRKIPNAIKINMNKKESGYRKLIEEVETILAKIENGETDIDDLAAEIKRAAKLLQDCKEKLFRTEQEVEKIMKSESE